MKSKKLNVWFILIGLAIIATMIALSIDLLWIILVLLIVAYIGWGKTSLGLLPIALSKPVQFSEEDDEATRERKLAKENKVWYWFYRQ